MYSGLNGLGEALQKGFYLLLFCLPLAIWKLIDIAIWLYRYIGISITIK